MGEVQVKMAKATKDDIQKTIEFFQFIEEFMEYGTYTPENEETEEDSIDLTDEQFVEHLRKLWGGRFRPVGVDCMWSRVVFGYQILVDNACDPDADTLEVRPDWAKLIADPEGMDQVLDGLSGDKEHFRQQLADKSELLAKVCDYAERLAKKKGLSLGRSLRKSHTTAAAYRPLSISFTDASQNWSKRSKKRTTANPTE